MNRVRSRAPRRASVGEILCAFAVVIAMSAAIVAATRPNTSVETSVSVTVRPGDTLWEIASVHAAADDMSTDQVIEAIITLNGLDGASLQPGTVLSVPVTLPSDSAAYAMR